MLDRFHHILLPLDFSDKNTVALDTAYDIVSSSLARVTLLHVIEPIAIADDEEIRTFTEQLRDRATAELQKRAAQFSDLDTSVSCESHIGSRSRAVISYSLDNDVDLIIVSSHPIVEGDAARSMASISYQIAVLASCPVLMLK